MSSEFAYDALHKVAICRRCHTCIAPTATGIQRHLREKPHRLVGQQLKSQLAFASTLSLGSLQELRQKKPQGSDSLPLKHLKIYDGYQCTECSGFLTTHLPCMRAHIRLHDKKDKSEAKWRECRLQTYFTARNRINYFVVREVESIPSEDIGQRPDSKIGIKLAEPEGLLFVKLQNELDSVEDDIAMQASTVQNFNSRSAKVPWLERTGFPYHLAGVKDAEIRSSYRLPKVPKGLTVEPCIGNLSRICDAAELVLQDAYKLCSDTWPQRKMTQQRASILNEFYVGASGKANGFRHFKNPSTLTKYFTIFKQLLVFYYRVASSESKHFTRSDPAQVLPGDCIQRTGLQQQAESDILQALNSDDQVRLKHAIRRLYLALICHTVGSTPFQSTVISFCAMLSRRSGKGSSGLWEEPGNFNSYLSALRWTAQLLIFDYVCFMKQDNELEIPVLLATICTRSFQQLAETPFGHILQWRLYLFKVGKAYIAKYQARWSLDGQTIEYRGLELHMLQVLQLVSLEYRQAHDLLYNELLFQAKDLVPMQAWRLTDDLDMDEFGRSWLNLDKNADIVDGAGLFLLRHIRSTTELRDMFVSEAKDGTLPLMRQPFYAVKGARTDRLCTRALPPAAVWPTHGLTP